jgi:uncharacterized protein YeaO (DUF488 family)
MSVRIQRAYEAPGRNDGYRVLVDRVWPRGRSREELLLDEWARDLGPSTELRRWFGHDPARWDEFRTRYRAELGDPTLAAKLDALAERARRGPVTIVYGARDELHNQARVIAAELERRLGSRGSAHPGSGSGGRMGGS